MKSSLKLLFAAVLVVGSARHAQAQLATALALQEGARVRVTAPQLVRAPLIGESTGDVRTTALLRISTHGNDARIELPTDALERVELSYGRARALGTLVGAAAGGLIGAIVGARAVSDQSGGDGFDLARDKVSGTEFVQTIVGNSLLGALAGYFVSPRGWQAVPLPH